MRRARSRNRLYYSGEIPAHGVFQLASEQAHHVAHVLRLAPGDAIVVFDGQGAEYDAVIEGITKSGVTVRSGEARSVSRESPLAITLAQGISSGERMDYTVQKGVELGVDEIQPIAAERSVVRLTTERAARRTAHWQAIAVAACEQCGRNHVPPVRPVATLTSWLGSAPREGLRLTLSPDGPCTLGTLERPPGRVLLLVGPEGGFSARERQDAHGAGFMAVRLGPRVLRTETAALAAIAAMQALWGDFGTDVDHEQ